MKIQNLYLLLAAACSVMLCFFSPVYFSSEEDAMHYFTMDFASINARTYDANNQLVVDESFTYATTDENGQVLSTQQGASIMSIWALPVLAILMAVLALLMLVLDIRATKLKDLVILAQVSILPIFGVLGYYAMLAMYVFFCTARFEFDWHIAWPACLPLIILILTLMAMRAFKRTEKKTRRDLSGSIR